MSSMKIFACDSAPAAWPEPAPVFLVQEPGVDLVRIDFRLGAEQPLDELLLAHFQAEDADGLSLLQRGVLRDVKAEAGLAQAGARGDDDQVGRMEAGGHLVELRETGLEPGDQGLAVGDLFDLLVDGADQRLYGREPGAELLVGEVEDRLFDMLQDLLRRLLALVSCAP